MASKLPFFLTGGNARIMMNNRTVAFCTDVSYKVSVRHAAPRVLGRFEVEALQPLSYEVSGTMTLIRYARGLKEFMGSSAPIDANTSGNGIGSYKKSSFGGALGGALGLPSTDGQFDGAADEAGIPGRMFQSKMFDIEIRQKLPRGGQNSGGKFESVTTQLANAPAALLSGTGIVGPNPADNEVSVVLLRDCRIEELDFKLNKRGAATLTLSFKAVYADDDTAIARKSGVGQELS